MLNNNSNFISNINIALNANLTTANVLNTNLNRKLLKLFYNEGFIYHYVIKNKYIKVYLKYKHNKTFFKLKLVSKTSWRKFLTTQQLKKLFKKHFFVVISTSKGIMELKTALNLNLGGEVLCILLKI